MRERANGSVFTGEQLEKRKKIRKVIKEVEEYRMHTEEVEATFHLVFAGFLMGGQMVDDISYDHTHMMSEISGRKSEPSDWAVSRTKMAFFPLHVRSRLFSGELVK